MKRTLISTPIAWLILISLLLLSVAAISWANLQWVATMPQESEFLSNWQAARGLIFNRSNPYTANNGEPFKDPLPALLFYFPYALIENYDLARAFWITTLQIVTAVFAYACLRNTPWKPRLWVLGVLILFAIFWVPAVSIFLRGSQAPLIAALFAAAVFLLKKEQDEVAGVLLALSALQLRLTLLALVFVLLWLATQRRWIAYFWAGVTFLATSILGVIFLPGWPIDFFWATLRHTDFRVGQVILETTTYWWPGIGWQIGWGIVGAAAILLVVEWWRGWGKDHKHLTWVLALTLAITIWVGYETNLDQVFLLLFAWVLIFAAWNRRWGRSGLAVTMFSLLLLLAGLWWANISYTARGIDETSNPIIMIAFPFLSILALYWIRWWYLGPRYLYPSESEPPA